MIGRRGETITVSWMWSRTHLRSRRWIFDFALPVIICGARMVFRTQQIKGKADRGTGYCSAHGHIESILLKQRGDVKLYYSERGRGKEWKESGLFD